MVTPLHGAPSGHGATDSGAQYIDGIRLPTEVRLMAVAELLPYARNSRSHSPAQIEALCQQIRAVGWTTPMLVADGGIIAGHGRLMAAQKLGLSRVPCIDVSHLDDTQRRALVVADNRMAELASWNLDMLKLETDDLRALGLDLEATTGFAEEDLAALFADMEQPAPAGDADPDAVPDTPDEPASRLGDVWQCGPHRVACGDASDPAAWDALLAGELADAVWVDPPYNVDLDAKNKRIQAADGWRRGTAPDIAGDKLAADDFAALLRGIFAGLFGVMKPGATIYVAHSDKEAGTFRTEFDRAGFKFSQTIIWKKNQAVLGFARFMPIHEPIIVGRKPGSKSRWYGGRKQTTVAEYGAGGPFQQLEDGRWAVRVGDSVLVVDGAATVEEQPASVITAAKPAKSGLHQSQKPVELVERMLRNSARPGDLVIDACAGSGTTLVAADRLGMVARVMELKPEFVDVIVRRWENLTGRRAVHAVTGEVFPAAGEVRAAPQSEAGAAGSAADSSASVDIF